MRLILAFDIGGTNTRAAVFRAGTRAPLRRVSAPTRRGRGSFLAGLFELGESILPQGARVEGIGVAAPGPLDTRRGVLLAAPNLPGLENLPLGEALSERFGGAPVFLGNDANLAALGEWRYGAARGHHNVLYLTISTGIGGGVICENHLLQGETGIGGELGHVTVLPDGLLCSCGKRGHLGALSSGTAIAAWTRAALEGGAESCLKGEKASLTAARVAVAARNGDALAQEAFARAGRYLGVAVAGFLHIFNPSILVFGGGVSKSGALLLNPFREALGESVFFPPYLDNLKIVTAALGEDAGLFGAQTLVQLAREDSPLSR